jgi:hypothetical protein
MDATPFDAAAYPPPRAFDPVAWTTALAADYLRGRVSKRGRVATGKVLFCVAVAFVALAATTWMVAFPLGSTPARELGTVLYELCIVGALFAGLAWALVMVPIGASMSFRMRELSRAQRRSIVRAIRAAGPLDPALVPIARAHAIRMRDALPLQIVVGVSGLLQGAGIALEHAPWRDIVVLQVVATSMLIVAALFNLVVVLVLGLQTRRYLRASSAATP